MSGCCTNHMATMIFRQACALDLIMATIIYLQAVRFESGRKSLRIFDNHSLNFHLNDKYFLNNLR